VQFGVHRVGSPMGPDSGLPPPSKVTYHGGFVV
jgi:hypothetical protein